MSRIFALTAIATVLLVGTAAIGSAAENSGSQAELLDDIVAIFATSLEIGALVPIALAVGLVIGVLGVMARL